MNEFSESSLSKLRTVHQDLQTVFLEVVKEFDCSVLSGIRTEDEQAALYRKGRSEPGEIVTYRDGVNKRSKHQVGSA